MSSCAKLNILTHLNQTNFEICVQVPECVKRVTYKLYKRVFFLTYKTLGWKVSESLMERKGEVFRLITKYCLLS